VLKKHKKSLAPADALQYACVSARRFGLWSDRIVTATRAEIRDVIAFPKETQRAQCPTHAPSPVDEKAAA
jgi:aspartyl-tRNA synthetase